MRICLDTRFLEEIANNNQKQTDELADNYLALVRALKNPDYRLETYNFASERLKDVELEEGDVRVVEWFDGSIRHSVDYFINKFTSKTLPVASQTS